MMRIACLVFFLLVTPYCPAAMIVGNSVGNLNDNAANVGDVIDAYNLANDPDLPTTFTLLGKTDDGTIAFDQSDGIVFWEDEAMTTEITTAAALHSSNIAYFTYDDSQGQMLYYSVKGGNEGFTLYTFWPGMKNILQTPSGQNISHASFWLGERPDPIPEPSAALIWMGLLGLGAVGRRYRCRA